MSIKYNPMSRRMFLQGMGFAGSTFAFGIPLLPSLLPSKAQAQAMIVPPRFVALSSENGAILEQDWFPSGLPTTNRTLMFPQAGSGYYISPTHYAHWKPVNYTASGISNIFDSKFNQFATRMNFLRGLDYAFSDTGNHNGAPLLGNIRHATGNLNFLGEFPTIDQIMAYTKGFYPNDGVGYVRSLRIAPYSANGKDASEGMSWNWENPVQRTGNVVAVPSMFNPQAVFTTLFGNLVPADPGKPTSTPYVDAVMAGFKRVRDGRAISSDDRQRLQMHMDLFSDLEKNLTTLPPVTDAQCSSPTSPVSMSGVRLSMSDADIKKVYSAMNDMIVLGFKCQRTRVATVYSTLIPGFNGNGGSDFAASLWHWASHQVNQTVVPVEDRAKGEGWIRDINKWLADNMLYDLVKKMDSITEVNGKTMLDNSLVQYSGASMNEAHTTYDMPVLTFGGAGGALKTGMYCDYRNRDLKTGYFYGILFNQWLVTAMQSVGLTPTDYNLAKLGLTFGRYDENTTSYGEHYQQTDVPHLLVKTQYRYQGPRAAAGNKLPFIT